MSQSGGAAGSKAPPGRAVLGLADQVGDAGEGIGGDLEHLEVGSRTHSRVAALALPVVVKYGQLRHLVYKMGTKRKHTLYFSSELPHP